MKNFLEEGDVIRFNDGTPSLNPTGRINDLSGHNIGGMKFLVSIIRKDHMILQNVSMNRTSFFTFDFKQNVSRDLEIHLFNDKGEKLFNVCNICIIYSEDSNSSPGKYHSTAYNIVNGRRLSLGNYFTEEGRERYSKRRLNALLEAPCNTTKTFLGIQH